MLNTEMKAVILAGGLGTRLSEETGVRPKPMVEIGGRPILWHILKIYSQHNINDFIICCGYKGYLIKEYFANYFLHTLAPRMNKEVREIPDEALQCLKGHTWPGNVRELQNFVERAIIHSSGPQLNIGFDNLRPASHLRGTTTQTPAEAERALILGVLKATRGVVSGPKGAASRLGVPRTTLMGRMQKLGIVQRKTVLETQPSGLS